MELTGKIAAVTGAGGTVGSAVARRLAVAGMDVRALTRKQADLTDRASLDRALAGAAVVVNCAAAMTDDPETCRAVNVGGVENLVGAFAAARCERLIHISSISAYDPRDRDVFDEDAPLLAEPPPWYGATKAASERIIAAAGVAAVILRPVMILAMDPTSYWGPLAQQRARTQPERIVRRARMPHVHVDNLAEAVVLAARTDAAVGRAYNAIDGSGDTEAYLAAIYGSVGRAVPPALAEPVRSTFPNDRIRTELGYVPRDRFHEFLAEIARSTPAEPA
jgi:nucleoside-diphosphate-sugar epimerase